MTDDELEAFVAHALRAYVEDRVANGGEDPRDAQEVAVEQMAAFFPDGRPAEGHYLFTARDETTTEHVGVLWLFERRSAAGTSAFIYDVEVDEHRRGQGWGRQLMTRAEQWAGHRGAYEIVLNVFGGNRMARDLYTSMGYGERAVAMAKPLRMDEP